MKYFFFFNTLLLAFMLYLIVEGEIWRHRCVDAGGMPAGSVCVNPAAIIEVD